MDGDRGRGAFLLGRPRLTRDVDALVALSEPQWPRFLRSGGARGFVARRAEALAYAHQTGVLVLRHHKSGLEVNLVFASLTFEREALGRATWMDLGGVTIPLPSPEDLIIMKTVAHRPCDWEDIEAILAADPQLHLWSMLSWMQRFATALKMPEPLTDLEARLNQRRPLPAIKVENREDRD